MKFGIQESVLYIFNSLTLLYMISHTGRQKKAKSFNVEEMFEKSRRTAQEYSAQVKGE